METALWCILVFVLRFLASYIVRTSTQLTLFRKAKFAAICDMLDESLTLLVIAILVMDSWYVPYVVSVVIGSSTATYCVAKRYPKPLWKWLMKKKGENKQNTYYHKKSTFTNA